MTRISQSKKLQFGLITFGLSLFLILLSGEVLIRLFLPFNTPDTIKRYSMPYLSSMFTRHRLKPVGRMVEQMRTRLWGKSRRARHRDPKFSSIQRDSAAIILS